MMTGLQFLEAEACEIPDTCVVAVATKEGRLFVVGHADLIGSPAKHQCEHSVLREQISFCLQGRTAANILASEGVLVEFLLNFAPNY